MKRRTVSTPLSQNKAYLFIRGLLVVVGGFLVHITLGTKITFGNVVPYITSYIRNESHPADLTQGTATWIYAFIFLGHGSTMVLGGCVVRWIGPRWTSLIGGWIMSLGIGLTYFTIKISFWFVLLTYGFMYGAGIGIAYAAPLRSAMKWLPQWKGFANGIVMSGLGIGPLTFNFVQTVFVNPSDLLPERDENGEEYFTDPDLICRVPYLFLLLGGSYAAIQLIGSLLLTDPPEGYEEQGADKPAEPGQHGCYHEVDDDFSQDKGQSNGSLIEKTHGFNGSATAGPKLHRLSLDDRAFLSPTRNYEDTLAVQHLRFVSLRPLQVLKKPGFYILWLAFFFNSVDSILIFALYKLFGLHVGIGDLFLATVGSLASISNSLGRITWGIVADKVSFKFGMVIMFSIKTIFLLTIYACTLGGRELYLIWVCVLYFCLGGSFNILPTSLARAYGVQYVSENFGLLYTAQTIAGFAGALLTTWLITLIGYAWFFFIVSGLSGASLLVVLIYQPKRYITLVSDN
jgi:MFS family permease